MFTKQPRFQYSCAMRPRIILRCAMIVCTVAACVRAQSSSAELLRRATAKVLDTVGRLPKYMCTQTIDRTQLEPVAGTAGRHCEVPKAKQLRLTTSDRLRFDVAVSGGREMYSWAGEGRFEDGGLFQLVQNGALSTGAFASLLAVVFRDDAAVFSYKGETTEAARQVAEFGFHVMAPTSHYIFNGGGNRVTTGYFGSIFVDPATADLVRLMVQTEGLPVETGACESSTELSYSRVRLNEADFLLPSRVQLHILNTDGVELENTTAYSGCHEFLGESTLSFDAPPEPGTAATLETAASADELPGDLPFTIALTNGINVAAAAAGDKLAATLTTPIRDATGRTFVSKGAAVTARVVQVRRFYVPEPMVRLVIKLETLEIAGTPRRLTAASEFSSQPPLQARGGFQRRVELATPDNQDPEAIVFEAHRPGSIIPGFESKWSTMVRKP
jgi:hypothetical protein